jgi:hypothetical protein
MSCPRPPLHFAPLPGRRRAPGRRRPSPLHRPVTLFLSVLYREGWEEEDGCFAHTPLPFFHFSKTDPPLFSHSFLSKQTLCFKLNHKNNPVPLQLCPWTI